MININYNYTYNQLPFTSGNQTIRRADDIALLVNRVFPRISSTNIEGFKNVNKHEGVCNRYSDDIGIMRNSINRKMNLYSDLMQKIKIFTEYIMNNSLGNCAESARLAYMAAKINGIDELCLAGVYKIKPEKMKLAPILSTFDWWNPDDIFEPSADQTLDFDTAKESLVDLDHAVVRVNNGGNPYVIDAWLGFADYVPNAFLRYCNEFGYLFDDLNLNNNEKDKIILSPENWLLKNIFNKVSKEDLRKTFPELILPEPKNKTS